MSHRKRMFTIWLVGILLLSACLPYRAAPNAGQDEPPSNENIELLAHIAGSALAVDVQGDYAYVGLGYEMIILDIADHTQPRWVGDLPLPTNAIGVVSHYAYVVGRGGFSAVDIGDPAHPLVIGTLPAQETSLSLAVANDYAFFVDSNGLHIVNVADPTQPSQVGLLTLPGNRGQVVVREAYAYVTASDGLHIVDITQPKAPIEVSVMRMPRAADGLALIGHYAYLGAGPDLHILDITDPAQPSELATLSLATTILQIAADAPYLYVAGGYGGIQILDASDPRQVAVIGQYASCGLASNVLAQDGYVYFTDCDEGLLILDAAKLPTLTKIGDFRPLGPVSRVLVDGNYAYVNGGWNSNLHLVELADLTNLHQVNLHITEVSIWDFALVSHFAYLAVAGFGLQVMDIATPSAPTAAGFLYLPGISAIKIAGDHAYASDPEGNFWALDIRDPANPQKVTTYPALGYAGSMSVADGLAYIPDDEGIRIMTIANAGALTPVSHYRLASDVNQIAVVDQTAYIATQRLGLWVVNVTDPLHPCLIGHYATGGEINDVVKAGSYAFLAAGDEGVLVVDVADPTWIREAGSYQTADTALKLTVVDGKIYVADQLGGLLILQFHPPESSTEGQ